MELSGASTEAGRGASSSGSPACFIGISDPYEPPESPEVLIQTDRESVEQGVERILEALRRLHGPA